MARVLLLPGWGCPFFEAIKHPFFGKCVCVKREEVTEDTPVPWLALALVELGTCLSFKNQGGKLEEEAISKMQDICNGSNMYPSSTETTHTDTVAGHQHSIVLFRTLGVEK